MPTAATQPGMKLALVEKRRSLRLDPTPLFFFFFKLFAMAAPPYVRPSFESMPLRYFARVPLNQRPEDLAWVSALCFWVEYKVVADVWAARSPYSLGASAFGGADAWVFTHCRL